MLILILVLILMLILEIDGDIDGDIYIDVDVYIDIDVDIDVDNHIHKFIIFKKHNYQNTTNHGVGINISKMSVRCFIASPYKLYKGML